MSTIAQILLVFNSLTEDEVRSLYAKCGARLKAAKRSARPANVSTAVVSVAPTQKASERAQPVEPLETNQSQASEWGIISSKGKLLRRRFASKADAEACIPDLVASTGLVYNATLVS